MTNEPTNQDRAEWADTALTMFQRITRCDREDAYADLLCDLMHLVRAERVDFHRQLHRAFSHFTEELREAVT